MVKIFKFLKIEILIIFLFRYCEKCISVEKRPIPWIALESFDLRSYSISHDSLKEIEELYYKPIIEIKYDSPIVTKSAKLYEFMVELIIFKIIFYLIILLFCRF